ncbi:hypothetical protein SESBI_44765 [Sesbania bispinosa]|nr:hypothetical protein SESBI_44765 [Sesbania bispinosa]
MGQSFKLIRSVHLFGKIEKSCLYHMVLKDYESRSWERILKVRVKAMGLKEKYPKVTRFMVMNGELLIFATE